jgi:hypothetical protein
MLCNVGDGMLDPNPPDFFTSFVEIILGEAPGVH